MKVQIIHSRDPDSECGLRVFVDDVETNDFSYDDLDPGRGWTDEDWEERIADVDTSTNYGKALRDQLEQLRPAQRKWAL